MGAIAELRDMSTDISTRTRTVVGVFSVSDSLEQAIGQLSPAGFGPERLGLLLRAAAVFDKLDHAYEEVEASRQASAEFCFLGREESKSTAISSLGGLARLEAAGVDEDALLGSASLSRGPLGTLNDALADRRCAERLQNYLDQNCLLLCIQVEGKQEEERARQILARFIGVYTEVVQFRKQLISFSVGDPAGDAHRLDALQVFQPLP